MRHLPMEDMKLPSMPGRRYGCSGRPEGTQSPIFALSAPHVAPQQASNTTLYYTALEGDSIFSIVAKLGRGVCNITRANRLMDAKYLFPGFSLIMPDAASNPDNDTCVLQAQNTTATCIYGGRLDCTTATNGPINRAALYKLNITVGSLWTENAENLQSGFVRRGPASQHVYQSPSMYAKDLHHYSIGIHLRHVQGPGGEIWYDSWADHHAELSLQLQFSCGNDSR